MGNCINIFKDFRNKKLICPKCKKYKWNKTKSKEMFLSQGCTTCTIQEKYSFKPIKNYNNYKTTGRYYNLNNEVTIENIKV